MEPNKEGALNRPELLYFLGGLGTANAIGLGTWLTLETLVPKGNADEYHKSVCRYCGTGCGVRVGLRNGQISDIRGDELAHTRAATSTITSHNAGNYANVRSVVVLVSKRS